MRIENNIAFGNINKLPYFNQTILAKQLEVTILVIPDMHVVDKIR